MAGRVYTSVIYAIVRLSIWVALLAAAAFDGIRHRQVRSKGWQLFTLLVASTALFVVKNIAFLAICIQGQKYDGWATASAYISYIFFGDIADSFWIFLLLAISAGFWWVKLLSLRTVLPDCSLFLLYMTENFTYTAYFHVAA